MGQGPWPVGSRLYRQVTPSLCYELGRGFYLCSMLVCSNQSVLAMAGLTGPHTCLIVVLGHGGLGRRRQRSLVVAATTGVSVLCWSLGLKTPSGYRR